MEAPTKEVERTFKAKDKFGNDAEFELILPNLAVENEGETQYRIAYSKALAAGIYPREKLREIMKQHEMWTDKDESEMKLAVGKLAILNIELQHSQNAGQEDECLRIAKELGECRERMWELFLVQSTVYMNSAEGVSEAIKAEAIMSACVMFKNSKTRYWPSYSEFVEERDQNEQSSVYEGAIDVQTKLIDFARVAIQGEYPERRYLKDVTERMLDREVEDEVTAELHRRAKKALDKIDPDNEKATKKPARKKRATRKKSEPVETDTEST